MFRQLLFIALLAALGAGCYDLGQRGARAYERILADRVASGFEVLGHDWARIEADGLKLSIHGHAPDIDLHDQALASARAAVPLAQVVSYATATLAPPEHRDPVRIELLRDADGITLTGQTAGRPMRERMNAALTEDAPGIPVQDLTGIQAALPPRNWGPELGIASLAASRMPSAHIVIEPGQVMIDGRVAGEEEREALIAALIERAGEHVALDLNIRTPARVIAPFAFSASRSAGVGIRLERCAARSYEEQALLRTALGRAGIEHPPHACPVGLGGPGGDWPEAIAAGIEALASLPAGRIDIEYRDARLFAEAPTSGDEFETALEGLSATLPEGFSSTGEFLADDAETRAQLARERYWMQITQSPDGIIIAGLVPDEQARFAIETKANALYGVDHVSSSLAITGTAGPKGWRAAAMRLLALLRGVRDGEAELAGERAFLRGTIEQPVEARSLHDRALAGLPDQIVSTAFRVDLKAQHAAIPLPPPRCAADLNAANHSPSIEFAPGSAVINKDTTATLDRMAAILQRCAGLPIEIGGHTDSQGREELNLRLSQARAEAVWRALVERGVPPDQILAHGFGAEVPIASNDTAAGRARNRRIAFEPAK